MLQFIYYTPSSLLVLYFVFKTLLSKLESRDRDHELPSLSVVWLFDSIKIDRVYRDVSRTVYLPGIERSTELVCDHYRL